MKKLDNIIGGAGTVLLISSLVWYSINKIWGAVNWALFIAGIIGLGYFIFIFFTKREKEISHRSLKYGSNVLVQVIIVLAIIALIAFISTRQHFRSDLTSNNLYSLSDQTKKIVSGLDKEVEIKAFFKSAEQNAARDLLDEYDYRSGRLSYELIDPDEQPQLAKQYGIQKYNMLSVESGPKRELIEQMNETNITNAIIKVTREQDKVIYFLTGHGERSIKDDSPEGYKKAAEAIEKENHLVRELNLVRRRSIPDSCTVLAIISPKSTFFPTELDTIKKFVDAGGKLLLMVDPEHQSDIAEFLEDYQLTLGNDIVIDASGMGQLFGAGPGMPLVTQYDQSHKITKGFNIMTFYPQTSSLTALDDKGGYTITEILKTGSNSWAETNFASGAVSFEKDEDTPGPITIAAVVEKDLADAKLALAVFGDSDFAKNGYFNNQGNINLFLNTINYLAEEEDLISIRPKQIDDRRLTMTKADVSGLFYMVVIAIPVIVIILGVVIFFRRNRAK